MDLLSGESVSKFNRWMTWATLLIALGVFTFHFAFLATHTNNLPFWDDWAMFQGDNHPATFDPKWFYEQYNDHRTTTTRVFVWLQFQLNGWNVKTHLLFQFLLYGVVSAVLAFICWKASKLPLWVIVAFVPFLFTTIFWTCHASAYAVAVHFWLIFLYTAALCMFSESQRWWMVTLGFVLAGLSIYSFASGMSTGAVLLVGYCIFKVHRILWTGANTSKRREILQFLVGVLTLGGLIAGWLIGYHKPVDRPPWVLPGSLLFWKFYLNLVSFGFGVERVSVFWGAVCFLIVMVPIVGLLWRDRRDLNRWQWISLLLAAGFLANLCAVAFGRSAYGVETSRWLEYSMHALPLVMFSVVNWALFLQPYPKLKIAGLSLLWLFCVATFLPNFDFDVYRKAYADKLKGAECVRDFYHGRGDGRCREIFPFNASVKPYANQAKRLNASFYRDLWDPQNPPP